MSTADNFDVNVSTIAGYIRLSPELLREIIEREIGPIHGPPIPPALALRRELGGHPAGPYRRARHPQEPTT